MPLLLLFAMSLFPSPSIAKNYCNLRLFRLDVGLSVQRFLHREWFRFVRIERSSPYVFLHFRKGSEKVAIRIPQKLYPRKNLFTKNQRYGIFFIIGPAMTGAKRHLEIYDQGGLLFMLSEMPSTQNPIRSHWKPINKPLCLKADQGLYPVPVHYGDHVFHPGDETTIHVQRKIYSIRLFYSFTYIDNPPKEGPREWILYRIFRRK